jgi:hypothetical protein
MFLRVSAFCGKAQSSIEVGTLLHRTLKNTDNSFYVFATKPLFRITHWHHALAHCYSQKISKRPSTMKVDVALLRN